MPRVSTRRPSRRQAPMRGEPSRRRIRHFQRSVQGVVTPHRHGWCPDVAGVVSTGRMHDVADVAFCVRAQLRARRAAWALLAILIGLSGAVVMVAVAGARRTDSAYTRYLGATNASDVLLSPNATGTPRMYEDIAKLSGAAAVAPVFGFGT